MKLATIFFWSSVISFPNATKIFKVKKTVIVAILMVVRSCLKLCLTFSGLAKVAIFTTNVDAENQTLINHKCVCGALNRHFCQTRVTCWPSVCRVVV